MEGSKALICATIASYSRNCLPSPAVRSLVKKLAMETLLEEA